MKKKVGVGGNLGAFQPLLQDLCSTGKNTPNEWRNITLRQFVPGLPILQEPEEDLVADPDIELSSFSAEVANINKNLDKAKTTSNGKGLDTFQLGLFFLLK